MGFEFITDTKGNIKNANEANEALKFVVNDNRELRIYHRKDKQSYFKEFAFLYGGLDG